jgi:hypothetical protein
MIGLIADRVLAIFVPRATAAAGCAGSWQEPCGPCGEYGHTGAWHQLQQTCSYSGNCTVHCGACVVYTGNSSVCI